MREILFRGKTTNKGEWVKGGIIPLDVQSGYIFIAEPFLSASTLPVYEIIKHHTHLVIPETVGQFTGLYDSTKWEELTTEEQAEFLYPDNGGKRSKKDWKGKPIFEGDIVSWGLNSFVIAWQDYKFVLKKEKIAKPYDYVLSCFDGTELKIIGNVTDNPELL